MEVNGKVIVVGMLSITAAVGIGVWYAQNFGYYEDITQGDVQLTSIVSEQPESIPVDTFQGIDANSSPIRYRACFTTPLSTALLTETYEVLDTAEPRIAPDRFACFDAEQIGADIESGVATAYMGHRNFEYGIDRVVAIYDDGRGFTWHQINECGDKLYDGSAASDDCPARDE